MPIANRGAGSGQEGVLRTAEYEEIKKAHERLKSRRAHILKEKKEHEDAILLLDAQLTALDEAEGVYTHRLGNVLAEYESIHKR